MTDFEFFKFFEGPWPYLAIYYIRKIPNFLKKPLSPEVLMGNKESYRTPTNASRVVLLMVAHYKHFPGIWNCDPVSSHRHRRLHPPLLLVHSLHLPLQPSLHPRPLGVRREERLC